MLPLDIQRGLLHAMTGWQSVTALIVACIAGVALSMRGHDSIAIAISGPIITGVFALLKQGGGGL